MSGLVLPPWLSAAPLAGLLLPGESTTLTFTAVPIGPHVASLSHKAMHGDGLASRLETVVLFHLSSGQDKFLTLAGRWVSSVHGVPLRILAHMPPSAKLPTYRPVEDGVPAAEPTDDVSPEQYEVLSPAIIAALRRHPAPGVVPVGSTSAASVPPHLIRLADSLLTHPELPAAAGVFSARHGLPAERARVRRALDLVTSLQDASLDPVRPPSVYSLADVFLQIVAAFPTPLVPEFLYVKLCSAGAVGRGVSALAAASGIPTDAFTNSHLVAQPPRRPLSLTRKRKPDTVPTMPLECHDTLQFVCALLRRVAALQLSDSGPEELAAVFAPAIMRPPPGTPVMPIRQTSFILQIIRGGSDAVWFAATVR
jgi:hypothetical protein